MKLKKTVFKRSKSFFMFLIVFSLILFCNSLNKPMQTIYWPVSRNKNISTPPQIAGASSSFNSKIICANFIEHDPIFIDGNNDFISQAGSDGWSGDGSEADPFVISGFVLINSDILISISNTNLYFQISNCLLTDGMTGISLSNVINGYIFNNTVSNTIGGNNERWGILLTESNNNTISNNTFTNLEFALQLDSSSEKNTITRNTLYDNINPIMVSGTYNKITNNDIFNNDMGITISDSMFITFSTNYVYNNGWNGVDLQSCDNSSFIENSIEGNNVGLFVSDSHHNSFHNNTILNNNEQGFYVVGSNDNSLTNNSVLKNSASGIDLVESDSHTISNNYVSQNNIGIFFEVSSSFHNIINNTVSNNEGGITILSGSDNNIIEFNHFINNGPNQASDLGINNRFFFNYWNDMTSPDIDSDGIVDNPYSVEGGNYDPYPLTSYYSSIIPDILTSPTILAPNGGEIYTWTEGIQWLPAVDSKGHRVVYSINISSDNGLTWELLASGLNSTNFSWNTSSVADGSAYLIKVVAHCSGGKITEDTSDGIFTIHNYISPPTILSPNGGEILNATIPIKWSPSSDSVGHDVTYAVYYSIDGGNTWILLDSGLTVPSYNWDSTSFTKGSNFTIKVVATCTEMLTAEDVSDSSFMIHYLTAPIISTSFGDDPLKGMITIRWTASTDSLGQDVTYSVYCSSDNGSSWFLIASDLTTTSYTWNTTTIPDGTNYKIKIVTTSSDGLTSENILDGIFSIHNAPPPPPDFSFLILGLAFIPIIPEMYFGRRLSRALRRKSEEGVG